MHFQTFCLASATLAIAVMAAPIIELSSLATREASVPRGFFNNNDAGSEVKRGFFNNADVSNVSKEKRGFFNNGDSTAEVSKRDEEVDDDGYYYTYTDSNK
ncbi:uncharacterized protein EAE97_011676 [Botrytis byssoidea]|uniref:RxLR effector protein n=1 Tax=Botrytis byssoidea TaxID=139641 RepID=A0A9P5LRC3_9HELO|nr:uncharacterized protein EAE97_011676 [Botrytis byssoidea]KAF7919344.1 hypothetical protein EAE97_011676 [Botrytis byssoidea]